MFELFEVWNTKYYMIARKSTNYQFQIEHIKYNLPKKIDQENLEKTLKL